MVGISIDWENGVGVEEEGALEVGALSGVMTGGAGLTGTVEEAASAGDGSAEDTTGDSTGAGFAPTRLEVVNVDPVRRVWAVVTWSTVVVS